MLKQAIQRGRSSFLSSGMGAVDLPLRASNEGLLRPRVARAQKINQAPSPLLFREHRINMGDLSVLARFSPHRAAWLILDCARSTRAF